MTSGFERKNKNIYGALGYFSCISFHSLIKQAIQSLIHTYSIIHFNIVELSPLQFFVFHCLERFPISQLGSIEFLLFNVAT